MSRNATSSIESMRLYCLMSSPSSFLLIFYSITYIVLILPLSISILHHGLQQWRSTSSAATVSHADSFTYHMVTMELIGVSGCIVSWFGTYKENVGVLYVADNLSSFTWYGEMFFHVLTCVERYLAVVHPITYLGLRKERGVRIRNICIGCVWLLCFAVLGLNVIKDVFIILSFFLLISSLIVISFCSLSVLWVLIRSGPGEQVGRREKVDQSKLRAFYTIVVILGVLVLRLTSNIAWIVQYVSGESSNCLVMACEVWFNFPSTLVLPLLFIYRTRQVMCHKRNAK